MAMAMAMVMANPVATTLALPCSSPHSALSSHGFKTAGRPCYSFRNRCWGAANGLMGAPLGLGHLTKPGFGRRLETVSRRVEDPSGPLRVFGSVEEEVKGSDTGSTGPVKSEPGKPAFTQPGGAKPGSPFAQRGPKPGSPFTQPAASKTESPTNPFRKPPAVPTDWEKAGARPAGSGKRVLDAFREGEKGGSTTKFGQPLVPKNIFDEVRRTPEEIAADSFKFEISPGQFLLIGSFLVIIGVMLGTVFLVWKVGAIHYNEL